MILYRIGFRCNMIYCIAIYRMRTLFILTDVQGEMCLISGFISVILVKIRKHL